MAISSYSPPLMFATIVAIALALSGCGGGGSGKSSGSTTSTLTTTTTTIFVYGCETDVYLDGNLANMEIKGMSMDDLTMSKCADKMLGFWPHTKHERVKNVRLFAGWKSEWGNDDARNMSWTQLGNFVKANDAKIFLGVDTSGDWQENEKQWKWGLELMQRLGKEHFLGFSFGNEMEYKATDWNQLAAWVQGKVEEMDNIGFQDVKLTVVHTFGVIDQLNAPSGPPGDFIKTMQKVYSDRWVWSVNVYSIFDTSIYPHKDAGDCAKMTAIAVGTEYFKGIVTAFRKAVNKFSGKTDASIWIGETGWSSPALPFDLAWCKEWGSQESLKTYYENFLEWDGSVKDGLAPIEHVFYFTNRDRLLPGRGQEWFGLVDTCANPKCKMQTSMGTKELLV